MIKVGRNILDLVSMNVDVMSIYSGKKIFMDGEESVVTPLSSSVVLFLVVETGSHFA